jgi:hypothetical protein
MTPCSLVHVYQSFSEKRRLHFQDQRIVPATRKKLEANRLLCLLYKNPIFLERLRTLMEGFTEGLPEYMSEGYVVCLKKVKIVPVLN